MIKGTKTFRITILLIIGMVVLMVNCLIDDYSERFIFLSALTVVTFITVLIVNPLPIASPFSLFIIVLFVYNCGQIWMNLFGIPILSGSYTIDRYSDELLSKSLLFFLLMTIVISVFYVLKLSKSVNCIAINEDKTIINGGKSTQLTPLYLFYFLLIICLVYDYLQYRIAAVSGYATALYARADNELLYMANCAFPFSVFWVMRSNIGLTPKNIAIVLSVLRYALTTLLIGYRMQAISFVLTVIVLTPRSKDSSKKKSKYFFLIVAGIILAGLLSIVSANIRRGNEGIGAVGIWESYVSLLQELGGTFIDLPIIIRDIGEIGTAYGMTYLCAILYLIPFIGHIIPDMAKYVSLSSILYTRITIYSNSSLGGSMLAEFFYNFRWLAIIIAAPILGSGLAKICNYLKKNIDNPFKSAMLGYIIYTLILFIRGNISEVAIYIRCAVYIYILHLLMQGRSLKIRI